MEIRLITVGKLKTAGTKALVEEYASRLSRFCTFRIIEIPEASGNFRNPSEAVLRESQAILNKIRHKTALCTPSGKKMDSRAFSNWLERVLENHGNLDFVIGGSAGVSSEIETTAEWQLSFSDMTFPHQLFRGMLCEQLYRAFTIMKNMPYHK